MSDYENPIDYHKLYNPTDSTIIAVKYLLYPHDVHLATEEYLIWVEAEYCNCYVLREVVDENIVFINRNSHYVGYYRELEYMKDLLTKSGFFSVDEIIEILEDQFIEEEIDFSGCGSR